MAPSHRDRRRRAEPDHRERRHRNAEAGAAAGIAAGTRLLFTPVLFGALLVGTNGLDAVPAAVLAASAAWLTMKFIGLRRDAHPESPAEEAIEAAPSG